MSETGSQNHSDGPADPLREDEVSLLDILLVLARHKTLIVRTVLVFTLLGVTYALTASEEFTSEARVVREAQSEGADLPGGISSRALSGFGINLGESASGLTPAAFPDVLQSREVRLAVVRDTFRFPDAQRPMTYVDYANQPPGVLSRVLKYTLWLPWTLKGMLGQAISEDIPAPVGTTEAGEPVIPSEEENAALKSIAGTVSAPVDEETGIMTISATAGGSQLASELAKSFLDHFITRVREIRTEKVRERLQFVKGRFEEAEQELEAAEDRLAQFLGRNQNPTTATLQFRRDRLQRQVSFKEQLYSELQSQLTKMRLDLQRRQPVVTVVEQPVPPMSRSAPQRTLIVLLSLILGGFLGIGVAFVATFLQNVGEETEEQENIAEIQEAFSSNGGVFGFLEKLIDKTEK
ncbi:Wzz/FepE/Etk N-terminal domain-containing protein [Salinibacter altiplanensis]|uniref:Wzz/FepE/Etk N-terminal domain-containing protein n=1 Tax=Salinibacter altiplanensis TaxID=1803181 RepID=UPI000C9F303C|nr:Wzz/FepE/Etk N-terminal domain-containing protein [Salinibacter altiplanensis]